jgi:intein/homing endonuclease
MYSLYDHNGNKIVNKRLHKCYVKSLDRPGIKISNAANVKLSCDCLVGETKVLTDTGWKTMYEIAEPFEFGKFPINYVINGEIHKGSAPFCKGRQPTWRIDLDNGKHIIGTKDHKFYVRTLKGKTWVKLKNLKLGDSLILNDNPNTGSIDKNQSFWDFVFLGSLMGDGSVFGDGKPDLKLYNGKEEILDTLIASKVVRETKEIKNGVQVQFTNRAYELMCRHNFQNKISLNADSHEKVLGYLSGLLNTDGRFYSNYVDLHGGKYLEQLQDYLMQWGYSGIRLCVERKAGTETNFGVSTKDLYRLSINRQTLEKLLPNLCLTERQLAKLNFRKKSNMKKPKSKIVSISYAGRQQVYDITVPGKNRFVANGIVVHNCEAFMFWCEYALYKKKASDIYFSNGKPPVVRNPKMIPYPCKHIYKLGTAILAKNM